MVINWDHPEAKKLKREIVKGLVEDMQKEGLYKKVEKQDAR